MEEVQGVVHGLGVSVFNSPHWAWSGRRLFMSTEKCLPKVQSVRYLEAASWNFQ